jgi:hypothetical protein
VKQAAAAAAAATAAALLEQFACFPIDSLSQCTHLSLGTVAFSSVASACRWILLLLLLCLLCPMTILSIHAANATALHHLRSL